LFIINALHPLIDYFYSFAILLPLLIVLGVWLIKNSPIVMYLIIFSIGIIFIIFSFKCIDFIYHKSELINNNLHYSYYLLWDWTSVANNAMSISLYIDQLSIFMSWIVSCIALLVSIYSVGYIQYADDRYRFFSYISIFVFFILLLVNSGSFIGLLIGWEGVGLISYLLVGFWYGDQKNCISASRVFIINRIADIPLIISILLIVINFQSLNFDDILINMNADVLTHKSETLIGFLLLIGAMGKSAQFFFHVWLPEAMKGPTPVSALMHSATMVTAGVFLLIRCGPLYKNSQYVLQFTLIVGSLTIVLLSMIAIVYTNIKKIAACSTCAQIGYMFVACGIKAYDAAIFHLLTHAFFKAMLFLCAGNISHHCGDELNIKKIPEIRSNMPVTHLAMVLGILSLCGFPLFAGYYSKGYILEKLVHSSIPYSKFALIMCIFGVFITAIYSSRLLFVLFYVEKPPNKHISKYEASISMLCITVIFIILTAIVGLAGDSLIKKGLFWSSGLVYNFNIDIWSGFIELLSMLLLTIGIIMSYLVYIKYKCSNKIRDFFSYLYRILVNDYYIDYLYRVFLIAPYNYLKYMIRIVEINYSEFLDYKPKNSLLKFVNFVRDCQEFSVISYINMLLCGIFFMMIVLMFIVYGIF
jgi:NADH-quinone oxidoreductase subunit L